MNIRSTQREAPSIRSGGSQSVFIDASTSNTIGRPTAPLITCVLRAPNASINARDKLWAFKLRQVNFEIVLHRPVETAGDFVPGGRLGLPLLQSTT